MSTGDKALDLTFVVIGYNESASLRACLESCQQAHCADLTTEIIYVDGGSTDDSKSIAESVGVDRVLGGDKQRRAAENRNLGLAEARGEFVQFVDGDMVLDPDWPNAALLVLKERPMVAVVFGRLQEVNQNIFYRALQLDWQYPEGTALYCGGAAMFRRDPLQAAGGFPEDVAYGEEPLLCWRLRNEQDVQVYHIQKTMAQHDLAYTGFRDYWRRNIRVGETYVEIAQRCKGTDDPFWGRETRQQITWGLSLVLIVVGLFVLPIPIKAVLLGGMLAVLLRKGLHGLRRGTGLSVAVVYAVHTYLAKISIAYGVLKWYLKRS